MPKTREDIFKFISVAESLAAAVLDNFEGITDNEPMVKYARMILPDYKPNGDEIYTGVDDESS